MTTGASSPAWSAANGVVRLPVESEQEAQRQDKLMLCHCHTLGGFARRLVERRREHLGREKTCPVVQLHEHTPAKAPEKLEAKRGAYAQPWAAVPVLLHGSLPCA